MTIAVIEVEPPRKVVIGSEGKELFYKSPHQLHTMYVV